MIHKKDDQKRDKKGPIHNETQKENIEIQERECQKISSCSINH